MILICGASSLSAHTHQKVQAVIFDCDGTLVDTEYLKFLSWQDALSHHDITFDIDEYMPMIGHSSKKMLSMIQQIKNRQLPNTLIESKNLRYKELQSQGVLPIEPMVDFAHRLSQCKAELSIKLGLASSASKEEILFNLRQIGLEDAFDLVISGSDDLNAYVDPDGKNKPKPYIYLEAAKRLGVSPESCLVFEDTQAGIDAAAAAGMMAIAVPNHFTLNQNFSNALNIISYDDISSLDIKNPTNLLNP
jgi:HAD superfamily hydrolase (TIGR01509 family)